ncbi:nucleoside-diphosphate-sugar pyrophosphorylase [Candidatus Magnetobacterium bavaricum]|uniref:Nucleoside-diphosphate-sugar pyrophosphorylase n=1 Tax=Candidatus Magnetobacterium bavaricum TaxID=29290 RepID=A0A0F3GL11_9BACT|nr:nucleoside-diphosphate-sugar pyrophosphorylase [Candidatus Magnetobacterium bavaricum]
MEKAKLQSLLIFPHATIKQGMHQLNATAEKILLVVNENNQLLGTVTDGDIRRALINGLLFSSTVESIMFTSYVFIDSAEKNKRERAKSLMMEQGVAQLPVIDKNHSIVDILLWTDIFAENISGQRQQNYENKIVIMAGGKGTRLEPFTRILPKALIPVKDKTIIELIMTNFSKRGFCNFIFTVNYKKEYIKMFLKDNNFPYTINWIEEDDYLGTAGGLSLLNDKIFDTFIVTNCDILVDADYADIVKWHKENNHIMTIVACHKEISIPYGILEMNDGILSNFNEKPKYDVLINTGVYVIEPEIFSLIPYNGYMDMNILIAAASSKKKVSIYPIHEGFCDIGQWEEYKKTVEKFSA